MSTDERERQRLLDTSSSFLAAGDAEREKKSTGASNRGPFSTALKIGDSDEEATSSLSSPPPPPPPPSSSPSSPSSPSSSSLFSLLWNSGTACVLTSAATRSGSAAALKGIDHRVRALWVVLLRSAAALALTALTRARSRELRDAEPFFGKPGARPLMLARGAVAAGSILFFYSAVEMLPLADALALNFLSPVVAAFLSWAVHGEEPGFSGLLAAVATVVGVALVAQPESLFGGRSVGGIGAPEDAVVGPLSSSSFSSSPSLSSSSSSGRALGVFLAIVSAFCAASGFTILRALSSRPEGPPAALTTAAYFHVCSFLGSSLPLVFEAFAALVRGDETLPGIGARGAGPPKFPTDLLLAVVLVGGGFVGQTLMNRAFLLEPAAKMSALNTTQVLDGHVYALLFLGERESVLGAVGSALIVGGAVTAALGKRGGTGKGKAQEATATATTTTTTTATAATTDPKTAAAAEAAAAAATGITGIAAPASPKARVELVGTTARPSPLRSAARANSSSSGL